MSIDKRQRVAQQRAKAREAIGILHGISELFGTEDGYVAGDSDDLEKWQIELQDYENWIFQRSPIA